MYPRYAGLDTGLTVNQAHNDWAQWAAEGGLPFLLVMILFAGLLCKPAFRSIYGLGVAACPGGLPDAAAARASGLVVRHGRRGVGAWGGGERRV